MSDEIYEVQSVSANTELGVVLELDEGASIRLDAPDALFVADQIKWAAESVQALAEN